MDDNIDLININKIIINKVIYKSTSKLKYFHGLLALFYNSISQLMNNFNFYVY